MNASTAPTEAVVAHLVEMGYAEDQALAAFLGAHGNFEQALDILSSQTVQVRRTRKSCAHHAENVRRSWFKVGNPQYTIDAMSPVAFTRLSRPLLCLSCAYIRFAVPSACILYACQQCNWGTRSVTSLRVAGLPHIAQHWTLRGPVQRLITAVYSVAEIGTEVGNIPFDVFQPDQQQPRCSPL